MERGRGMESLQGEREEGRVEGEGEREEGRIFLLLSADTADLDRRLVCTNTSPPPFPITYRS